MCCSYGSGRKRIDGNKKCRQIDGNFYCHGDAAVQRGAHIPIEHVQGFTRSHWTHHIAPTAAMVNEFVETTQNSTNKTQLLASNYSTFRALEFHTPKRTLYSAHQCNELRLNVKHHDWSAVISSYQTLSADKK
jgi:hypothetical protein